MAQVPSPTEGGNVTVILETPKQKCFKICKAHFQIVDHTFKCEEFGPSATTNYIYKCSWGATEQEHKQVLVRIYGKIVEEPFPTFLIKNLLVFNILAERNLGPKCYGYNQESRIEELYTSVHVERSKEQLVLYYELIARKIAEIHTQDMPLTKAPTFLFDFCTPRISNIQNLPLTAGISEDAVTKIKSFDFDFEQNLTDV
ncbi:choline/ethanolamine kinase, partial [Mytilus galloprovincialis]